MRIDEREGQDSARCKARAQLFDEIPRLFPPCMRKNRISEYEIKLNAQIRYRQIDNALGIERTVVAIVVKPIRLRKSFTTFFDCVTNYVETVIIPVTNRARRIEQQVSLVPTKIKHTLVAPVRMIELCVKIGKLRRLHELRTHRPLFFSSAPEMNFFDHIFSRGFHGLTQIGVNPHKSAAVLLRKRSSSEAKCESSPRNSMRSITVNRDRNSIISCSGVVGLPGTFRPIRDASTNRRTCDQTCGKTTTRHAW